MKEHQISFSKKNFVHVRSNYLRILYNTNYSFINSRNRILITPLKKRGHIISLLSVCLSVGPQTISFHFVRKSARTKMKFDIQIYHQSIQSSVIK